MKKKLIALLCIAGLLLTTAAIAAQAEPKQEVNTRPVEISDALDILKSLVGIAAPLPLDPYDFNENNIIDVGDALEGLKSIIKIREPIMIAVKPKPTITSVWEEVPIARSDIPNSLMSRSPFDLRAIITGSTWYSHDYTYNTYVFSGTIVGMKEYLHSWTNDSDKWGPFARAILEVKITKEYNGKSPVDGDIIKVVYPFSLSDVFNNCFHILGGVEYVFVGNWVLDEKYTDYITKYSPYNIGSDIEKHGDVIMGAPWCSLFPIQDDKVIFNHAFLLHDEAAMKNLLPLDTIKQDIFTTPEVSFCDPMTMTGGFVVMNRDDFEEAFLKLFENPEKLPTSDFNPFVD